MSAPEEIPKEDLMPKLHPCFYGISLLMLRRKRFTQEICSKDFHEFVNKVLNLAS